MFEALSDRLDGIFTRLRGRGRLSPEDVDEALREIRMALLQADVNLLVVRDVIGRLRAELVGAELSLSLSPGQQVVKAVHDELVRILGGTALRVTYASRPPTVVLLAGLQGAGKTTNAAKLARWFKQQGRNPLLVGADLQRPPPSSSCGSWAARSGVPGFLRGLRPGDGGQKRPGRSGPGRPGRPHRRHRRPPAHRHGNDGPGPPDFRDGPAPLHVPRHRRHDGPGRRHDGGGVP